MMRIILSPARLGLVAILAGFGGFLLWAAYAPLDEGVPAPGVFALDTHARPIQQVQGGRVTAIAVREGDHVRKGQLLVTLDDTTARADLDVLRIQYLASLVQQDRLVAEYAGRDRISWSDDVRQAAAEPALQGQVRNLQSIQATLLATRERGARETQALLKHSDASLGGDMQTLRALADEGYFPRNRLHEIDRSQAEVQLRALQAIQDYRKEVETQLTEASRESAMLKAKVLAQEDVVGHLKLLAPDNGIAMALSVHAIGDVVRPGDVMLHVVPEDEPLVLEAQVPPEMASRVHAGLAVDVRLTGLQDLSSRSYPARVRTISPDRLDDPATHRPYYLARIDLEPQALDMLKSAGNQRLQPGLPFEALIKTGQHTLLAYLTKPLRDRMATALVEH